MMQQCRVRTDEPPGMKSRGVLKYESKIQTIKSDFWKEGVDGSKRILKKILKKINDYEMHHINLEEEVNRKLGKRFRRINGGESLFIFIFTNTCFSWRKFKSNDDIIYL